MARCGLVSLCSERSCSSFARCDPFARYLSKLFVVLSSNAVAQSGSGWRSLSNKEPSLQRTEPLTCPCRCPLGRRPEIWACIPVSIILLGRRWYVNDRQLGRVVSQIARLIGQPLLVTEHPVSHGLLDRFGTRGIVAL